MTGTLSIPTVGQPNSTEDPKINSSLTTINGLLTAANVLDGAQIGAGTIVNAAISASAAIAHSKLANATAGQVLLASGGGAITATTISGDVTVTSGGVTAIGAQKVLRTMLDQTNVTTPLGLNDGTNVRRGKSIIATSESRTNVAYGTLTTPDQVTSVVLPTDGLLLIGYQARWQNSVSGNGRAAIFIGANQLKVAQASGAPLVQEAQGPSGTGADTPLSSTGQGLIGLGGAGGSTADVTTGQLVSMSTAGGFCVVFAAAGTYTVSVQFKSASGSVTVADRKLWVWAVGF